MRLLAVLLVATVIPALGLLVSLWIISDANSDLLKAGLPSYGILCSVLELSNDLDVRAACNEYSNIVLLRDASIVSAILGLGIPLLYWLSALFAGKNRRRLSTIFPPLVRISVVLLSVSVLLQGAIFTYAAYIGQVYAIERVFFILVGAIGLGALLAAIRLIVASFGMGRKLQLPVFGKPLSDVEAPKLHAFVEDLCTRLGARPPNNIVVGLEPTFFATSADVRAIGHPRLLQGETLFLSLPLTRVFSMNELAAVVGHELGHFRGDDTLYSMKFAPVYAGLGRALGVMETGEEEGASGLAKLPALALLSLMFDIFSRSESAVSRDRELEADRAGAEAASALTLVTALMKVVLYSSFWPAIRDTNVDRLNEGKIARNLSKVFADAVKFDVDKMAIEEIIDQVAETSISHPTDTHPTIAARMKSLGVARTDIRKDALGTPPESAIDDLIDGVDNFESELTVLEHQLMVAIGRAHLPEEDEEGHDYLLRIMYALGAAMVAADGKILPEEIHVAEGIGRTLFDGFDPIEFREACENVGDLPSASELAVVLNDVLEQDMKREVVSYLRAISEADEEVAPEEEALLAEVIVGLGMQSDEASG